MTPLKNHRKMLQKLTVLAAFLQTSLLSANDAARLAAEVATKGWIVFPARSEKGDWDLFLMRPDGTQRRNITNTPDANESYPLFSRDGTRLLFRRLERGESIDGNDYGRQGLPMVANSNGTGARAIGGEGDLPWASWSLDGKEFACLSIKGVTFADAMTGKVKRTLKRSGFFQQLTWSPDGTWLSGVSNSFGTAWSVARMNVKSGETNAVSTIDNCTPDWFPDSKRMIFSNRHASDVAHGKTGWTQLWMADADGKNPQLVYAEDGRHVYGGHVSPDGRYVLFTGNPKEDGDPANVGAPMALIRLADAPIIGGDSAVLRKLHPQAKSGPVLALPNGLEPCWTLSEIPAGQPSPPSDAGAVSKLAAEAGTKGWLVFSSRTDRGDWDLFCMRPDGRDRRKFIDMPAFNEGGARFSPDGTQVLFYRLPQSDELQNNEYGRGELVIAGSDGSAPVVFGSGFSWATWSPNGRQIACLAPKGIQIVDLASRKIVRELPRKGIVSQLSWSPDGKWFTGTADHLGPFWNIARMDARTGDIAAVSEIDRYNCTPDWSPDSRRIVYARGIIPEKPGRAELWIASLDGRPPQPLYAEESHHIYGACASPDMKHLIFTRHVGDATRIELKDTTMAIIRSVDTPMRGDDGEFLRKRLPNARTSPRLDLGSGWEPCWTSIDLSKPPKHY